MSDKELLFVGTSWRGWGKLRFELSWVRKEEGERQVYKAEGTASARAPRWRQTGAEMRGWEEHRGGGQEWKSRRNGARHSGQEGWSYSGGTGEPRQDFEQG